MLRFAGDDLVVVVERDARVVDLAGGAEHALELTAAHVIDLAAFPDRIWAAERDAAGGAALVELRLDGWRLPGGPHALPSTAGRWVPGFVAACAVWHGPSAAVVSAAPGVVVAPIAERADLVVPYSSTRLVHLRGAQAMLRTTGGARWTTTVFDAARRIEDGAFLYDGSGLLLVSTGSRGRDLVVLTTRDGVVQQRLSVAAATSVQLAARRGHVLVQIDERRLVLVDLQLRTATSSPGAGWIGFDDQPLIDGFWYDGPGSNGQYDSEPNDGDAMENGLKQFVIIKPGNSQATRNGLQDSQGGNTKAALCECDGKPIGTAAEVSFYSKQ